jgi:hypothetical protein
VGGRSCCCWICRARGCIERSLSHDHVTVWRFFLSPSRHFFRRLEFSFFTWCLGGIFFNHHYHTWDDVVISIFKVAGARGYLARQCYSVVVVTGWVHSRSCPWNSSTVRFFLFGCYIPALFR